MEMMEQAWQIAPRPLYRKTKPERNPEYRRFIKRFPCAGCGSGKAVDPAHTGSHGIGQKSSDLSVIPLCRTCHREFDQDPVAFAEARGLQIDELTGYFQHLWEMRQRKEQK